jgi:hypothetical protein
MATDVKLDQVDGTYLVLEGRVVKAITSDFMLDSAARHTGATPFRRALVHDYGDGLTVNYNGDYPGGVRLVGVTEIIPQHRGPRSQLPSLVVRGGISYEVPGAALGGGASTTAVDLGAELYNLQSQLSVMSAKVAALEAKVK